MCGISPLNEERAHSNSKRSCLLLGSDLEEFKAKGSLKMPFLPFFTLSSTLLSHTLVDYEKEIHMK
jgi:hypothetical protein